MDDDMIIIINKILCYY